MACYVQVVAVVVEGMAEDSLSDKELES
ncbi:hypothetical protein CCACVL1_17967 [Corchorus capsularis]|uniref:Uncharacterized protein n=1 Tax=Corchorus capsularis TaxID=210143 RepID=A0A1R3HNY9_COCAP|nr:hypothetical protein CCACVL1_17967 [Corchorus capsularis]